MLMGAYVAGADPTLDEAIARRADQLAFVSQPAKRRSISTPPAKP